MARARRPPELWTPASSQARQIRPTPLTGAIDLGPGRQIVSQDSPSGVSRFGGQAGTQAPDPTPVPHQNRGSRAGSTIHIFPADYSRLMRVPSVRLASRRSTGSGVLPHSRRSAGPGLDLIPVPARRVLRVARRAVGTGLARIRRLRGRPSRRLAGARCCRRPGRARGGRGPGLRRFRAVRLRGCWQGKARNGPRRLRPAPRLVRPRRAGPAPRRRAGARCRAPAGYRRRVAAPSLHRSTASAPGRSPFRARMAAASDRARPRMGSKAPARVRARLSSMSAWAAVGSPSHDRVCGRVAGRGRQRRVPDPSGYLDRLHGGPPRRRAVSGVGPGHRLHGMEAVRRRPGCPVSRPRGGLRGRCWPRVLAARSTSRSGTAGIAASRSCSDRWMPVLAGRPRPAVAPAEGRRKRTRSMPLRLMTVARISGGHAPT